MHIEASNTRDFRAFPLSSRSVPTRSNQSVRRSCEFTAQRDHPKTIRRTNLALLHEECLERTHVSSSLARASINIEPFVVVVSVLSPIYERLKSGFTPDAQPNESRKGITIEQRRIIDQISKREPRSSLDVLPRSGNESSAESDIFNECCLSLPYTSSLKKAAHSETPLNLPPIIG